MVFFFGTTSDSKKYMIKVNVLTYPTVMSIHMVFEYSILKLNLKIRYLCFILV